jgi:hypothetical protein
VTRATTQHSGRGANRRESGAAYYVYGVLRADVDVAAEAMGVGKPPGTLGIIRQNDIAALVSEVDPTEPLGTPDDLLAHQRVLDAAAHEVPVLPMRFGAVLGSRAAVAEEFLAAHHDEFSAALAELEGLCEFIVRGRYDQAALLTEILRENSEAARLAEKIRGTDEQQTRDMRISLGEMISAAISAKRERDTTAAMQVLSRYCEQSQVNEPTHEEDAVHLAVLIPRRSQADVEQALGELARTWKGKVSLRLLGPLAPYDFVAEISGG